MKLTVLRPQTALVSVFLLFSCLSFSLTASASTELANPCESGLLSPSAVAGRYASLVKVATDAPDIFAESGLVGRDLQKALFKISFLTAVSLEDLINTGFEVRQIKSPAGIPDGDELNLESFVGVTYLSALEAVDAHLTFQTMIDFLPLIEGKVGSSAAAMVMLKLAMVYHLTPPKTVTYLDDFHAASEKLREELKARVQQEIEKMDGFGRAVAKLVGLESANISPEIVFAAIESAIVAKAPISDGVRAIGQIMNHERASKYTIHEQAAMLKALLIFAASFDESVEKLAALEGGARKRFGHGLEEPIERPAVNLVLLGHQPVDRVLDLIASVEKDGEQYGLREKALVLNRTLFELSQQDKANANLLRSAVVIPE